MLLAHLPNGHVAEQVCDALVITIATLTAHPAQIVDLGQGAEMDAHHLVTMATDMPIYFCDPASPWQRGSNENTNGLLRQHHSKGTDLTKHTA